MQVDLFGRVVRDGEQLPLPVKPPRAPRKRKPSKRQERKVFPTYVLRDDVSWHDWFLTLRRGPLHREPPPEQLRLDG